MDYVRNGWGIRSFEKKSRKMILLSKRAKKEKNGCFWNYAPLFFLYFNFKIPKVLKFFLPLPYLHYNLWKILMIFECIFSESLWILKSCKYSECLLHEYFEWKHKPKHLSKFWWENMHLTWVPSFIIDWVVNLKY